MFKKLLLASSIVAISSGSAYAATEGPYVGAGIGANYALFKAEPDNDFTAHYGALGASADLFAGYGKIVKQNIYLGGELFTTGFSSQVEAYNGDNGGIKATYNTRYSYGASFIPGILLSDNTMAYARLGIVRTSFKVKTNNVFEVPSDNNADKLSTGGQAGLGLQTSLSNKLEVRGEYDLTDYQSFTVDNNKISPLSGQVKLGLVYNLD